MPAQGPRAGAGTPITTIVDRICLGGGSASDRAGAFTQRSCALMASAIVAGGEPA
jgi:hypothetical protein